MQTVHEQTASAQQASSDELEQIASFGPRFVEELAVDYLFQGSSYARDVLDIAGDLCDVETAT